MTIFLVMAACLASVAVAFVVRPLLKSTGDGAPSARVTALVTAVLLPLAAYGVYRSSSGYDWQQPEAASPPGVEAMVSQLENRLQSHPDDVPGWQLLGRSELVLERFPQAIDAFEHAYKLTGGKDAEVDAGLAEALAMSNGKVINARAAALFEEALVADPRNPRALWFGGVVAMNEGKPALARERWMAVLDLGPPPEVARALAREITRLDKELGRPPDRDLMRLANASPEGAAPGEGGAQGTGAGSGSGHVARVTVSIAPALAGRIDGSGTLFVFAEAPGERGPPLAVKRFAPGTALPLNVELSDADAMVPTRSLATVAKARIVARYSLSGRPLPSSGDLEGAVDYDLSQSATATLVIGGIRP